MVAEVNGIIGPASARYMVETIKQAEDQGAESLVFELDTPGGLDDSMRMIIKRIMSSKVPIMGAFRCLRAISPPPVRQPQSLMPAAI